MMEEYLKELLDKEFILQSKIKNKKTYSITAKGIEYLNKYSVIIEFTDSFGLNF